MEHITNWATLWRELVEARDASHTPRPAGGDAWRERARGFQQRVRERWTRPDSSRQFLLSQLDENTSVLDIGSGTGAWTVLLALNARLVTALDPSLGMLEVLRENVEAEGLHNVAIVRGSWPEADVRMHDLTLCAHAMYMTPDLPLFVRRMMQVTRKRCFLLMRAPLVNSVMSQAAQRVWGQPHDSPNFVVGYNVLLQMGLFPSVLMEDTGDWGAWTNASLDEAFDEIKRKLGLAGPSDHDSYLRGLLKENLREENGQWVWPPSMRSALVYWDVER